MSNRNTEVHQYFLLRQEIMLRQKDMLTSLVDKRQRYTKGILCEEIVRTVLREFLPSNWAVAQGFVDAKAQRKSKQCDVLIYDRSLYAPLLEVNDLVVLPVDAVQFAVEVKAELNKQSLKKALENLAVVDELSAEFTGYNKARRYIVAFDSPRLQTIAGYNLLATHQGEIGGICVLNRGFLYPLSESEEGSFEVFPRDDALFVFIFLILKEIYFRTGMSRSTQNPYDAYIDAVEGSIIK